MRDNKQPEIRAEGIWLSFGGVTALSDVSFEIRQPEILAIIGPNGAGKTSLLNCLNGFYRPQRGKILYNGVDLTRIASHKIATLGVGRTFQNLALYTGLTVVDNLMAARHHLMRHNIFAGALYLGWAQREIVQHRKRIEEIIDFLELASIRKKTVGELSYGQRKRVEFGRALALDPRVLLLDEPMAGMNVEEKEDMARFILDTFELERLPIVIIEHDIGLVMDIADRILVLNFGRKIAEGTPEEIKVNRDVIEAYLGSNTDS